jgi:hypothetical protein
MKINWNALILLALLASNLSARPDNSRPFSVPVPIIVNGAEVPAGIYELNWETQASTAFVTLSKDGLFVAGGKGTWVKQGVKYMQDAVLLRVNANGSHSLLEIRLAGSKKTIVFDNPVIELNSNRPPHSN